MDWQKKNLCLHETNPFHTIVDPHASVLRLRPLPSRADLSLCTQRLDTWVHRSGRCWIIIFCPQYKIQTTLFFRLAKMLTLPFASLVLTNHLPSLFQHRAVLGALAGELDKLKVENRGKQLFIAVGVGRRRLASPP